MAEIRLYRKFVCINTSSISTTSYDFITPFGLTASTMTVANVGGTIIESELGLVQESLGIYYVDLEADLYSGDVTYEVMWNVVYVPGAPVKQLTTRFRIIPNIASGEISIEVLSYPLELDVKNISSGEISIEVLSYPLDLGIQNNVIDVDIC